MNHHHVWEQRELVDLFEENNERNEDKYAVEHTISIASMLFNPAGNGAAEASLTKYKVLRMGDVAFEGHKNKEFAYGRFVMNDIGNGIMSPRFTTLRPKFNPIIDFWKYYIHYEPIMKSIVILSTKAGTMMNELVVSDLLKNHLLVPNEEEQAEIGRFFVQLDDLITLHQREYDKTVNLKKAMLEKMFPKNGEDRPEIRFRGFTDAWEQRKFSEQYVKVTEKNDLSFGNDKIISVANMYFKEDVKESDDDYMRTYNVMRLGDIAFEGNKSKNFAHGRFVENTIGDGIVSHIFDVFRPIVEYDLQFWKYLINNEGIVGRILTRCTKASTMMTNLVADDFLKEEISVPSLAEQTQIGTYFHNLDNLITLHQRELIIEIQLFNLVLIMTS